MLNVSPRAWKSARRFSLRTTLSRRQPDKALPRSEYSEQCAVIAWARLNVGRYPCLRWLHASLNGVRLTPGLARKMKAAGMTAGVADLFLPYASGVYHGLYIEVKVDRNRTTPEQDEFIEFVRGQGYRAEVARGYAAAVSAIEDYLEGGRK